MLQRYYAQWKWLGPLQKRKVRTKYFETAKFLTFSSNFESVHFGDASTVFLSHKCLQP